MKSIFHYILLVGLPVLGIVGLLRIGDRITPPISVGGNWQIEVASHDTADTHWNGFFNWSGKPVLTILQSGPHVRLAFKNGEGTTLAGTMTDLTLTAASTGINLEARLDQEVEQDILSGKMTIDNCSTPLLLRATREPAIRKRKESQ